MAGKKTDAKKAGSISKSALVNAVVEASGGRDPQAGQERPRCAPDVAYKELKKNGIFTLPGFAKFRVVKKPATKARQGINPFTKQPMTFAAKPASKSVRARPIKAIKDALA